MPSTTKTSFTNKQLRIIGGGLIAISVVALGIVLIVVNSGPDNSAKSSSSSKPNTSLGKEYADAQTGVKITPPAGWAQVKPTPAGDIVDFQESQQDFDSGGNGKSTLSVITSQAQGTLDQYAEAISTINTKNLKNYREVSPQDLQIDGQPAKILNYTASVNGRSLRTAQLIIIKNNILYGFNSIGLVSSWSKHEVEISKSFASIKLP